MNKDLKLVHKTKINAPVSAVWDALTNPEVVKKYFFGTQLDTNWRPGRPIYFRGEWEGKTYEDKGTVLFYEPQKHLSYNYWSSMSGKPDIPENYAKIDYDVEEHNGETIVTVTQNGIENEESLQHSENNWKMVMGDMKKLLES